MILLEENETIKDTVKVVTGSWGNDGFAFIYRLLQYLESESDKKCTIKSSKEKIWFAAYQRMPYSKAADILDTLAELEFIDKELWKCDKVVWCQWLVDSLSNKKDITPDEKSGDKPETKHKKKKPDKINYAENVTMTEDEYSKLVSEHGEARINRAIEILDNYKGANGKRYKSDYRAILNWVINRVNEEIRRGEFSIGENVTGGFVPSSGFQRA